MGEDLQTKEERWKTSLQKVQNEIWTDPPRPSNLYHYSSLSAIRNILSSQELWLSDIRFMNDTKDGKYWMEVFRPIVMRKSLPPEIKKLFQSGSFGLGSHWTTYIACFSPESEVEYQWKKYADEGKGCTIELSFEALATNCDDRKAYAWMPMLYNAHEQADKAEKTIDAAIMLARDESMTAEERRTYWGRAALNFLTCGARFKRHEFHPEREWRVFMDRIDLDGVKHHPSPNGRQVPYLALHLNPEMVTGVIRGASCTCPDVELVTLLTSGGYIPDVRTHHPAQSTLPL